MAQFRRGSQFANGPGLRVRVNLVKSEEKVWDEAYSADPGGASYFLHSCKSCADIQPKNKVERKDKKLEFSFPTAGRRWVGNISGN